MANSWMNKNIIENDTNRMISDIDTKDYKDMGE